MSFFFTRHFCSTATGTCRAVEVKDHHLVSLAPLQLITSHLPARPLSIHPPACTAIPSPCRPPSCPAHLVDECAAAGHQLDVVSGQDELVLDRAAALAGHTRQHVDHPHNLLTQEVADLDLAALVCNEGRRGATKREGGKSGACTHA